MLSVAVSAAAETLSFQQGDGGAYSETAATTLTDERHIGHGGNFILSVVMFDLVQTSQSFIRFPDIIGNAPGQIPPGSTITFAVLDLTIYNGPTPPAATSDIHEMYVAWDEYAPDGTILNLIPGTTYGPSIGTVPTGDPFTVVPGEITSIVQHWVDGDPNWGVMLRIPNLFAFLVAQYYSDDATLPITRPKLTVEFTPPPVPAESTTWGSVKALYR